VHRLHGYLEVECQCGMTMRVPELFENDEVVCIRCGAKNPLPSARERFAQQLAATPPPLPAGADQPPLEYRRRGSGWENFRCSCGQTVQLSPSFAAPRTKCPKCRRMIEVEPAVA
jgi:heat shock protein HtpX